MDIIEALGRKIAENPETYERLEAGFLWAFVSSLEEGSPLRRTAEALVRKGLTDSAELSRELGLLSEEVKRLLQEAYRKLCQWQRGWRGDNPVRLDPPDGMALRSELELDAVLLFALEEEVIAAIEAEVRPAWEDEDDELPTLTEQVSKAEAFRQAERLESNMSSSVIQPPVLKFLGDKITLFFHSITELLVLPEFAGALGDTRTTRNSQYIADIDLSQWLDASTLEAWLPWADPHILIVQEPEGEDSSTYMASVETTSGVRADSEYDNVLHITLKGVDGRTGEAELGVDCPSAIFDSLLPRDWEKITVAMSLQKSADGG